MPPAHHSDRPRRTVQDDLFTGSDTITLQYGNNINYLGKSEDLLLDVHRPAGDSTKQRAAICFVHGGGFRNGHRNDPAIMDFCGKLARKGYVVISIDYRLGQASDSDAELSASIVRAIQDLDAAIRFVKANAQSLGIDSNLVFISGASAGGMTVLCKAYMKIDSTANRLGVLANATSTVAPTHWLIPAVCRGYIRCGVHYSIPRG